MVIQFPLYYLIIVTVVIVLLCPGWHNNSSTLLRIAQQLAQNKIYIRSFLRVARLQISLKRWSYYIKPPQLNYPEHVNYPYVRLGDYVHRMDGNIVVNSQFAT